MNARIATARASYRLTGVVLTACSLLLPVTTVVAAETPMPPSVNKPIDRTQVPPQSGPQYTRMPIEKQPGSNQHSAKIDAVRKQLAATEQRIAELKREQDRLGALNQQDQVALQQAMTRQQRLQDTLAELLQAQSDTSSQVIGNIK